MSKEGIEVKGDKVIESIESTKQIPKETPEQIAEAEATEVLIAKADGIKKKWNTKKVFLIEVEDEDTGEWIGAWIRKPNLKEFSMFTKLAEKDNLLALKTLITNIFLEGDKKIYEDDEYFLGAIAQVQDIVSVQASRIKKF